MIIMGFCQYVLIKNSVELRSFRYPISHLPCKQIFHYDFRLLTKAVNNTVLYLAHGLGRVA